MEKKKRKIGFLSLLAVHESCHERTSASNTPSVHYSFHAKDFFSPSTLAISVTPVLRRCLMVE